MGMSAGIIDRRRMEAALEDRRTFAVMVSLVSLAVLVFTQAADKWHDLDHYYDNAGSVLDGMMPYSGFTFEYPPLSLVFMIIPRLLSWDLESYHFACSALAYAFVVIGALVLDRFSDDMVGTRWQSRLIILLTVVFCSYFVIARNDIFAAVLALIGVRLFQRDRAPLAAAVVAVAAMVKLYPAVLLLPMLALLACRRDWRGLMLSVVAAGAVVLLVELPFLLTDPSTAFAYLTYHSDRGIQVESVAGGLFLFADMFVQTDMSVVFGYGSDNVVGHMPDALAPLMNPVMILVLLAFVAVFATRILSGGMDRRRQNAVLGAACAIMVMLFICFSKVYSAQYLIWIMLLLPLTQASCFDSTRRGRVFRITVPFGIFSMLSYFSYACFSIYEPNAMIVVMIVMKNVFHIALTVELLRMFWAETRLEECGPCPARWRMR